jgi:hypothetical protein
VATTAATVVGLAITIVVLLALFDASTPRHATRMAPAIAVNSPDAVAQPHQAAATPRAVRHQRSRNVTPSSTSAHGAWPPRNARAPDASHNATAARSHSAAARQRKTPARAQLLGIAST